MQNMLENKNLLLRKKDEKNVNMAQIYVRIK